MTVNNTFTINNLDVDGTLSVTGDATFTNINSTGTSNLEILTATSATIDALTVNNTFTINDLVVDGTLNVTGVSTFNEVDVGGTLDVTGDATFNDLTSNGVTTLQTLTAGDTTVNNLNVNGTLDVTGNSTFTNINSTGTSSLGIVTATSATVDNLTVNNSFTINDLRVNGALDVTGPSTLNNLVSNGTSIFNGSTTVGRQTENDVFTVNGLSTTINTQTTDVNSQLLNVNSQLLNVNSNTINLGTPSQTVTTIAGSNLDITIGQNTRIVSPLVSVNASESVTFTGQSSNFNSTQTAVNGILRVANRSIFSQGVSLPLLLINDTTQITTNETMYNILVKTADSVSTPVIITLHIPNILINQILNITNTSLNTDVVVLAPTDTTFIDYRNSPSQFTITRSQTTSPNPSINSVTLQWDGIQWRVLTSTSFINPT